MLRFLGIRNLAVIEQLEVEFAPGLNVLTGETGAGKSILVGAIGLLVGGRASADLVRTGEETATVQAVFDTDNGEVIARREVTSQGRSRAFLDGALTTAASLREQVLPLVDLHGQHEHQALLDPETHLDVLDAYAGLSTRREAVARAFGELRRLHEQLDKARRDERERLVRTDVLGFQLNEIERAAPKPAEDEHLASTKQLLANVERVQRLCAESYGALYESDDAVLPGLGQVWKRVAELAALEPAFAQHLDARDAIKSQLEDLASLLRDYASSLDSSPVRLQEVEDRLALLERLKRKYGPRLADVIERQAACREELSSLERAGERASELQVALSAARDEYVSLAGALSSARHRAAEEFARELEKELLPLAMERTRVEVRFEADLPEARWSERGTDVAEFYVSPNLGEEPRSLARIVSGGELSRIMLALKTIASTDQPGKTLIFDEVDAGIGGRVADAVGSRLATLAKSFQILSITHLPQIASYASRHLRVSKLVRGDRTITMVEPLDRAAQVQEVARMVSGAKVSPATMASAREMLEARGWAKGEGGRKRK
jgi:DNA repair protein RecN (Recombination protein N)